MKKSALCLIAVYAMASSSYLFAEPAKALEQLAQAGQGLDSTQVANEPGNTDRGLFDHGGNHGGFGPHPGPGPGPHPHPGPGPGPHPGPDPYPPQQQLCQGTFNGNLSNGIRISLTLSPFNFSNVGAVVDTHGGGTFYGNGKCDDRSGQFEVTVQWLNGPATFVGTIWQNGYRANAQGSIVGSGLGFTLVRN